MRGELRCLSVCFRRSCPVLFQSSRVDILQNFGTLLLMLSTVCYITNIGFIVLLVALAVHGIRNCRRLGLEPRFEVAYLGMVTIGVGSWMFHMTLSWSMQLLDELPSMSLSLITYQVQIRMISAIYSVYIVVYRFDCTERTKALERGSCDI